MTHRDADGAGAIHPICKVDIESERSECPLPAQNTHNVHPVNDQRQMGRITSALRTKRAFDTTPTSDCYAGRSQRVDATHALKRSAGVS